jgi:hypothetical protein
MATSFHTYQKYLNPSGDPVPLNTVQDFFSPKKSVQILAKWSQLAHPLLLLYFFGAARLPLIPISFFGNGPSMDEGTINRHQSLNVVFTGH